jgi:hypothetical protein
MLAVACNQRKRANMHLVAAISLSLEKKDESDESGTRLTLRSAGSVPLQGAKKQCADKHFASAARGERKFALSCPTTS